MLIYLSIILLCLIAPRLSKDKLKEDVKVFLAQVS